MIELNGIQLDKTSAVPLYEQLHKALLEAITSGKLSAGTKLPTEEELCAQFGISRPVARQAYNMLIEEGFVERMRGRGTFVRSPDTRGRFLNKQLSFAAEMGVLNLEHRTKVLRAEWVSYTPELFARLKLERGDRCYHLVRMRYVSGKPFVLVENYVPESVFPGIDAYNFANLFGVHRGSPVLYVENVVMDQNDRPIDLSKEYLDGVTQKFEFEVVNQ